MHPEVTGKPEKNLSPQRQEIPLVPNLQCLHVEGLPHVPQPWAFPILYSLLLLETVF